MSQLPRKLHIIAAKAVISFGEFDRWCQVQEEAGELIAAINHRRRGREGKDELLGEVVDMTIALAQAKLMLTQDERERFNAKLYDTLSSLEGPIALSFSDYGPLCHDCDPAEYYERALADAKELP